MINKKELRVGNYVLFSDDSLIFEVDEICECGISVSNEEEATYIEFEAFEGIALNKDCMFNLNENYFDFVGFGNRLIYQDKLFPAIKIEKLKSQWAFYFNHELIQFKTFLHEAQNFYFALTNNELETKTEV